MKVYSLMLFIICLNISAFILNSAQVLPVNRPLTWGITDLTATFSLTVFAGLGIGGALIGVVGLITRTYVYAAGAILIWILGILLPIASWFLNGVPMMLTMLLPSELSYISSAITAVFMFIFFIFIVEIMTQRQIT